jgi:uncharacterized membrane protein YhaH (DUF805 family)
MKEAWKCFTKNYNNFSGRASQLEFFLYHVIVWGSLIALCLIYFS